MVSPVAMGRAARTLFRRYWASTLFVLCALGIWGWISWEAAYVRMVTWEGGADYWEHSATLHALIENPWHPRHPHLSTDAGSPRFGPQFLLVALIARAVGWDAMQAMTLAAVLNTLLFLCGIRLFFRSYFRHPLAPLYGLLVMFGGWWVGFHFSNVYSLPMLFLVASFPSTTALGLTLLGFALAVRVLRGQVARPRLALVAVGLWAGAVFIIHPLTAMMSLSGALVLAVSERTAGLAAALRVRWCGRDRRRPGPLLAVFFTLGGAPRRARGVCGLGGRNRATSRRAARQEEATRFLPPARFARGARLGRDHTAHAAVLLPPA